MAENREQHIIRGSWQEVFTVLKAAQPGPFEAKTFADVKFIGPDPADSSFMLILFNEETRD